MANKEFKIENPALQFISTTEKAQAPKTETPIEVADISEKLQIEPKRNRRLQLLITEESYQKLHALKQKGYSMNEVINKAIEEFLK